MLENLVMLASYSSFDNSLFGQVFQVWESAGFFSYFLPFLLIFALVFALLSRIKIFEDNKYINGIIAFVVGLMALQFDFVPRFFSEIFPRLGVGLAILLIILILAGLFLDPDVGAINWVLLGIVGLIAIIILIQTAGAVGWSSGYWWQQNWPMVAGAVFILVALAVVVGASGKGKPSNAAWAQGLRNGKLAVVDDAGNITHS